MLGLPSDAAVNLESKGVTGREALSGALQEAERHALSDYLVALASGAAQGGEAASDTVARRDGISRLKSCAGDSRAFRPTSSSRQFNRANRQVFEPRSYGSVSGPDPNRASALT